MQIEIRQSEKQPFRCSLETGVFTIGSDDDCRIRLRSPDVDRRHAILTIRDNGHWIEDLDSGDGTFVNGSRIRGRQPVAEGDAVKVGPFDLILLPAPSAAPADPAPDTGREPPVKPPPEPPAAEAQPAPNMDPGAERRFSIKQQIHRELLKRLDIKRLSASNVHPDELRQKVYATLEEIVRDVRDRLPGALAPETLVREIYDEAVGLGPLEAFLSDPDITEIMVNGHAQVYIEKHGKVLRTDKPFMDDASVLAVIERIVSPIGRRIDESQPYVDARLPDGSRVNAVIHPLSLVGPCLTIRKFSKTPFSDMDLIGFGTLNRDIAAFARVCIQLRKNIVISGGTGSGKTTLLNVLSGYLPDTDRIITIEDAAELRLSQTHVVRLEARPPNIEGKGAVTIRDLVRNALRMRPDRIVVGECRGGEALDMLQAMNTGHDGSLTTVHANTPRDVISRLETMVLMSGMDLPVRAIREQIAAAIDLIVHETRFSDGSRKVVKVTELVGLEGEQVTLQDLFEYVQSGVDAEGRVIGQFRPTGAIPTFIEDVQSRGLSLDRLMFAPEEAAREDPA